MKLEVHGDSSHDPVDSLAKSIDGTHIDVIISKDDQLRYIGRKGTPTFNVLAACDFDLLFIFVLTGWEGSSHDSHIFLHYTGNPSLKFPNLPSEVLNVFNRAHSSLKSCIEKAFGILKARREILEKVPKYSWHDQNTIICATFTFHNYIRLSKVLDPTFNIIDIYPNFIPLETISDATPMKEEA
ncbi:hypothetical protein GQ457_05G025060 [Hibiscus cannabinus]